MDEPESTITLTEQELIPDTKIEPVSSRCQHIGLRGFTFSDGQTIECCPTCNAFDKHRREVLCPTKGGARG
jgi:hypothetical protein